MRIEQPFLVFEASECGDVTRILRHYILQHEEQLPPEDQDSLGHSWRLAGDLSLYNSLYRGGGGFDMFARQCRIIFDRETALSGDNLGVVRLNNERRQLQKSINWAAQEFRPGGPIVVKATKDILESGYGDMEIAQALQSTDKSLARRIGRSVIQTGIAAERWTAELAAETNK